MSRKYELLYILSPLLDEENNKNLHETVQSLITNNNGTVDNVDHWGRKRLAYEIEDQTEGDYCVVLFSAEPSVPVNIERELQITDGVMRYMIVAIDEE